MSLRSSQGFSILEALIAATLVAGTVVTMVHLVYRAGEQAVRTELAAIASTLAQAKLERLRAARFAFDPAGIPVDDPELALSPDNTHLADAPGYVEAAGRFGEPVDSAEFTRYLRRWSVATIGGNADTRLLTVCVTPLGTRASAVQPSCVWSIRTRQP